MKSPSVLLPGINHMNGLNHNALTCSAVPIPPWERSLQTVEAQPYFNVSQASLVLEGIVFDRNNNLLFVDVATGRVFKLTPERQLSIVLKENSFGASGLAVHKDGRIFIASVGDMQRGSVRAIEPNGTREQMIVAPDAGFLVNDLVFDNQGGFYFTDSRGNSADPQGGVFYVSPNVGSIHAILPGLAVGNGIAIDPVGSQIWATEHAKNRLHRVRLSAPPRSPRLVQLLPISSPGRRQTGPVSTAKAMYMWPSQARAASWSSTATDCLLGKLCCLTATKAVTLNRQAWRSAPGIASCLLSLTAGPNLVER